MKEAHVRLRSLLTGTIAVALTACAHSSIAGPGDVIEFTRAKARWDARTFVHYSFEIRTFCFCPPEMTQWTRVVVRNGVVEGATPVEANPEYPPPSTTYYQPIDSLFSNLRRAMSEGDIRSHYSDIIVEYDSQLGYPTHIEYRSKPNIADGGATIDVRNVQPINLPAHQQD